MHTKGLNHEAEPLPMKLPGNLMMKMLFSSCKQDFFELIGFPQYVETRMCSSTQRMWRLFCTIGLCSCKIYPPHLRETKLSQEHIHISY